VLKVHACLKELVHKGAQKIQNQTG